MINSIGQTIKRLRKERDMTQEKLAELLGVTSQTVSKWENETGLPDISQVVPLASVFGVTTDELFGIAGTTENEEAWKIVSASVNIRVYSDPDTYLNSYDILMEGLKKYPNNLIIMNECMNLGATLLLSEEWQTYVKDRSEKIMSDTIRQADFIIENAKNISDVLSTRKTLVFLYSVSQKFDLATYEARKFPVRPDFTLYSNMAIVNEYMGNHKRAAAYFCSDIDYSLQGLEDNVAQLGKAYYNCEKYHDAVEVYETFFEILKAIFKNECPPPYHDFDSGDCYLLLAQAYLAIDNRDKAMEAVENSIKYYLKLYENCSESRISHSCMNKTPLVMGSEVSVYIDKSIIKPKLLNKLATKAIQPLNQEKRFIELRNLVNRLPE